MNSPILQQWKKEHKTSFHKHVTRFLYQPHRMFHLFCRPVCLFVGCRALLGRKRILFPFSPQCREELISIVAHCSPHLHKAAVWTSQIITQSELNLGPAPCFQWATVSSHLPERTPLFWFDCSAKWLMSCYTKLEKLKRFQVWTFVLYVRESFILIRGFVPINFSI